MSNEILEVVLDLKQDMGEVKGVLAEVKEKLTSTVETNTSHSVRIRTLELNNANAKGRASAFTMVGTFFGAGFGYMGQALLTWVKARGHS